MLRTIADPPGKSSRIRRISVIRFCVDWGKNRALSIHIKIKKIGEVRRFSFVFFRLHEREQKASRFRFGLAFRWAAACPAKIINPEWRRIFVWRPDLNRKQRKDRPQARGPDELRGSVRGAFPQSKRSDRFYQLPGISSIPRRAV